jgi:hypothetical protein
MLLIDIKTPLTMTSSGSRHVQVYNSCHRYLRSVLCLLLLLHKGLLSVALVTLQQAHTKFVKNNMHY